MTLALSSVELRISHAFSCQHLSSISDQGPHGREPALFRACDSLIVAWQASEVGDAFDRIERAREAGHWLAGYCSYELGFVLESSLCTRLDERRSTPLMAFAICEGPDTEAARALRAGASPTRAQWTPWQPAINRSRYREWFDSVHAHIHAGDIYQANLTFSLSSLLTGDPIDAYFALQSLQPVEHGAYVDLGIGPRLLSRSPELFFAIDRHGELTTRPMKGTQPRNGSPEADEHARRFLKQDAKNRAENLMIVDMLRNDVGRIARIGSVRVPQLFTVEEYETVFQMVSEVRARLLDTVTVQQLFAALHPCGSITGAPKIRAMQIIRETEQRTRDAYCGAIGWLAPDGSARFNVAIRTISADDEGQLRLDVGGGVVFDSCADGEYEEALWKARFADPARLQLNKDQG